MASANSRLLAIKIINSLREQQGSLTSLLDTFLGEQDADNKALVQAICFGVCRQFFLLQHLVDHFLQKPLRNKDQDIYCLLLIGSYQLLFMRMPDYAVIHECVACCTKLRKAWAKKLVNAILRSVQRDGASLVEQTRSSPSLYFSHPDWMLKLLQEDWPDYFLEILAANNQQAPMTGCLSCHLQNARHWSRTGQTEPQFLDSVQAPGGLCFAWFPGRRGFRAG
jgi:16S rRNA (cytosine967-C5)-methyltransferase